MISIFMSELNIAYSLFSIFIALSASIICFDIALNLVPKSTKRNEIIWLLLATLTFSLGTKTAYVVGISGLFEFSTVNFRIAAFCVSFMVMFITSFLGLKLQLNRNTPYLVPATLFTIGNSAAYFIIIVSNSAFTLSFYNKWFLFSVLTSLILNTVASYLVKQKLLKNHSVKIGLIGVLFGISMISIHLLSIKGLQHVITYDDQVYTSNVIVPFLLLSVFLFMFIALIGNRYQQKLLAEQRKLASQERYYRSLYELNSLAIIMMDLKGTIIDLNLTAENLAEMKKEEMIGMHYLQFIPEHDQAFAKRQFEKTLTGEVVEYEVQMYNSSGEIIELTVRNIPISVDHKIHGIYGMIKDISEEKRNLEKVQFMAYHAPLTNLPNKRRLSEDMAKNMAEQIPFSLVYLDLNEFKKTNDRYGHLAGDAVLVEVANRLRETKDYGTAYHIGGDEFAVAFSVVNKETLKKMVIQIADKIRLPITFQEFTLEVFASIGIARFPFDARNVEELLQKADLAMYASKEIDGSDIVFYHETLLKKVEERFLLEQNLKEALEKNQFELYYQPQFEIQTGTFRGAEALLRWNHPDKGLVSPDAFIHVLEETGLIVDVGEWAITQVLESIHSWAKAGFTIGKVSVNISAKHFEKQNLFRFIQDVNAGGAACLSCLDIEITESALLNLEKSIDHVLQLKKLGISISLDDFGTGYSSLSVLHQLPIDFVKIDQSFIKAFNKDAKSIIKMIIHMSNNLNVKVVAEGIETKEQLDFLIQEGCSFGQGYYYSKPLPKAEFEKKWLKK
ncbi:putative bifunctional diguanylate cyclase/phosphodiesterase [Fredinandcohnia sp. FSL W7-1320]|uniref:putative bifunctional diguanylate cyclase/phosphodiesterase n=1 Tax=Fredinandcohnia sp. FSL W7-1320 TaxID=2954540 RepID=UPI0030FD3359